MQRSARFGTSSLCDVMCLSSVGRPLPRFASCCARCQPKTQLVQCFWPWLTLCAFSPGWWLLPNFVVAGLLTIMLERRAKFVAATAYFCTLALRMLSPWAAIPLAVLLIFAEMLAFALYASATGEWTDSDVPGAYGSYVPLHRTAPSGCTGVAADVLAARDYFTVRACQILPCHLQLPS